MKLVEKVEQFSNEVIIGAILGISAVLVLVGLLVTRNGNVSLGMGTQGKVAVTIFPVYDMVRNIAGDELEVVLVSEAGASPHDFELRPDQVAKVSGSSLVLAAGHGLDDWVVEVAESVGSEVAVVDRDIPIASGEGGQVGENGDPHYWLSATNAMLMSRNIRDILSEKYPNKSEVFDENNNVYQIRLAKLDGELKGKLEGTTSRNLAVFHGAWDYLANAYGLTVVAEFEESANKAPTPESVAQFMRMVKNYGVKTVFVEPQFASSQVEAVAADLEMSVGVLDPLGGVEGRDSYEKLLRFNIGEILDAQK